MGQAIKGYRKKNQLTQNEFANLIGISRRTVSDYEKGTYEAINPKVRKLIDLYIPWLNNNGNPLECIFDYVRIRIMRVPVDDVISDILNIATTSFIEEDFGMLHYDSCRSYGHIKVLYDHGEDQSKGVLIEMTGQGCREYERLLEVKGYDWGTFFATAVEYNAYMKRIDLAINDYYGIVSIPDLIHKIERGEYWSKFQNIDYRAGFKFSGIDDRGLPASFPKGSTIYFGSPQSNFKIVFYEKNYEQVQKFGGSEKEIAIKNRYELRFSDDYADALIQYYFANLTVTELALSIMNGYITFFERPKNKRIEFKDWQWYEPWRELLDDVETVKLVTYPKESNFDTAAAAMARQYGSTLAMIKAYQAKTGDDLFDRIISNSEMKTRQHKMLEAKTGEFERLFGDKDWGMNGDGQMVDGYLMVRIDWQLNHMREYRLFDPVPIKEIFPDLFKQYRNQLLSVLQKRSDIRLSYERKDGRLCNTMQLRTIVR